MRTLKAGLAALGVVLLATAPGASADLTEDHPLASESARPAARIAGRSGSR